MPRLTYCAPGKATRCPLAWLAVRSQAIIWSASRLCPKCSQRQKLTVVKGVHHDLPSLSGAALEHTGQGHLLALGLLAVGSQRQAWACVWLLRKLPPNVRGTLQSCFRPPNLQRLAQARTWQGHLLALRLLAVGSQGEARGLGRLLSKAAAKQGRLRGLPEDAPGPGVDGQGRAAEHAPCRPHIVTGCHEQQVFSSRQGYEGCPRLLPPSVAMDRGPLPKRAPCRQHALQVAAGAAACGAHPPGRLACAGASAKSCWGKSRRKLCGLQAAWHERPKAQPGDGADKGCLPGQRPALPR